MASSSSSSSTALCEKFDVFLSFRGEDTRNNFTSHLYASLCRHKVETFIDNELKRGDEISPALSKTIEESKISVIIFSKDYASSKWCLDELEKILECKKKNGQMVVPVFYHINPSDVRKQTGSFAEAFAKHEAYFKERIIIEKVERWRAALREVANLSGWDSLVIRPESILVDEIVKDIVKKLRLLSYKSSLDSEGLIGIDSHVETIKTLLCIGLSDFRSVGIWGMGGIGKTTIARAVFNQMFWEFEGCCFLANVREESGKCGLVHLREEFISKILEEPTPDISIPNIGSTFIKDRLRRKKVLIVLDDVDSSRQLDILGGVGIIDRFGPGSRIIITTRDKQVLNNFGVDEIYEVEGLNSNEALQLFRRYAFKQNHQPTEEGHHHMDVLSKRVVNYANGIPLALIVLGSFLYRKSEQEWRSALNKLERVPNADIQNVLRISYDGLDDEEKDIFLDIACFFRGAKRDYVHRILDGCGFAADIGLSVLSDKCLITINSDNKKLGMHDLLQEMGLEIVRQESIKEPGKRSRLWIPEDVHHVLTKNTGTEKVEGIFLDQSKIREMQLSSGSFTRMYNLRLLNFFAPVPFREGYEDNFVMHIPDQGLESLSDRLCYLHWHRYPLKSLPSSFNPENLLELNLCYSHVNQLWNGVPNLVKLKQIDLSYCRHLTGIPDLSRAINLESINLEGCTSLVELPSFIQCFHKLISLNLSYCTKLKRLPSGICNLNSMKSLTLLGCSKLKKFPDISEAVHLSLETGIAMSVGKPQAVECLSELTYLDLGNCTRLKSLPGSICSSNSLATLILSGCSKLKKFPDVPGHIKHLFLDGTGIEEVPSSIERLSNLRSLNLGDCPMLKNLPSSISKLSSLNRLVLSGCSNITKFPQVSSGIEYLSLKGTAIEEVPPSIESLSELHTLMLENCTKLKFLPSCIHLQSRCSFSLSGCSNINKFPDVPLSIFYLWLDGTGIEEIPASIERLSNLTSWGLANCQRLKNLPSSIYNLNSLHSLNLSGCSNVTKFPEVPKSICILNLDGTGIGEVPPSVEHLSNLSRLDLGNCKRLERIPSSICKLEFLKHFNLSNCPKLDGVPEILEISHQLMFSGTSFMEDLPSEEDMYNPSCHYMEFNSLLPGFDIPPWLMHQSMGSSLSVLVRPHWCNSNLKGVAVCAVFDVLDNSSTFFHDTLDSERPMIECKDPNGIIISTISEPSLSIKSSHLWLCYLPRGTFQRYVDESCSLIKVIFGTNLPGVEVKKCGLHLIYKQDVEGILHGFDKSFRPKKKKKLKK